MSMLAFAPLLPPDPFGLAAINRTVAEVARVNRIMGALRIPEAEALAGMARVARIATLFEPVEPVPLPPRRCCCGAFPKETIR